MPAVDTMENPSTVSCRATEAMSGVLSASFTLRNTVPPVGTFCSAPNWLLQ